MIEIQNLSKTYNAGKPNEVRALRGVSFTVDTGELLAITGASGAGKSTLLHILACIDRFDEGEYRLNGCAVRGLSDREYSAIRNREIGIVLQDFALINEYTVLQNVMTPLFFSTVKSQKKRREMAMQALEQVGIGALHKANVQEISGGQAQRVAIARALVNHPQVLLADEPTGNLDSQNADRVFELFRALNQKGHTVVLITHDDRLAARCPREIRLADGRVVEDRRAGVESGTQTPYSCKFDAKTP